MASRQIYQLKITLSDIEPLIWRRIQVPSIYTFWDLHSAIQDAFGWTNSHIHMFTYTDSSGVPPIIIGIPEYEDDEPATPGWEQKIKYYIEGKTSHIEYTYDFGDNWRHTIEFEETLEPVKGFRYPFCVDGARACPPEDCGGPCGYMDLLEILADPEREGYEDTKTWVESVVGGPFKPEQFYPAQVKFVNPAKRFRQCFE